MLKKIGRALSSKNRVKVRLDVRITSAQNLPPTVVGARIVWARDAKVQMTKLSRVAEGKAGWGEELSIIATLDRNSKGIFEPKVYDFKLQSFEDDQRFVTLGKAQVDMARYADARNQTLALPVDLAGGHQAVLTIVITASAVKGLIGDDDAGSIVSGISELSASASALLDQDLKGFEEKKVSVEIPAVGAVQNASLSPIPESRQGSMADPVSPDDTGASAVVAAESQVHAEEQKKEVPSDPPVAAPVVVEQPPAPAAAAAAAAAAERPVATVPVEAGVHQEEVAAEDSLDYYEDEPLEEGEGEGHWEGQHPEESYEEHVEGEEGEYYGEEGEHSYEEEYLEDGEEGDVYYMEADVADLEARLAAAEASAAEAEAVAEEAVQLLEAERAERRQSEALVAQLQRDLDWANKKAAKERADWEGRMKDSFKKMEGTVLLTERVQREKTELAERLAAVTAEKKDLESMLDRDSVETRVKEAAAAARTAAEAQAAIEIEGLKKKVREMEEFVEESDAKALKAQGKATALAAQLAGAKGAAATDGWEQVRAAEEKADGLSLELQYAKAECRNLEREVTAAKEEADRAISAARKEAEGHGIRAAELARQLEAAMAAAAVAERNVSQSQGRIVLLEDALERSNLQAAELRQRLVAAQAQAASAKAELGASPRVPAGLAPELELAMQQVREVQDAAEGRAAQLAATSRELMAAQEALAAAQAELHTSRQELAEAQRIVSVRDDEVRLLREQLKNKEAQGLELRQLQKDMAALVAAGATKMSPRKLAAAVAGGPATSEVSSVGTSTAGGAQSAVKGDDIADVERKLAEAESLARSAALQTADLIQQLATSQAERQEAATKIAEMREELARLRSGSDGDLLRKIETLERELVVAKNRAEVNNLFREEHERIAGDLIATKLAWAEAQEQILVLKRNLVKSQERSMGFAAKLTKLETKLYRRLTNAGRKKSSSELEVMDTSVEQSADGSRPMSGASDRSKKERKSSRNGGSAAAKKSSRPSSRNKQKQ